MESLLLDILQDVPLCFLDESGDHLLHCLNPDYPVFVLAGVLFKQSYYETVVKPEMAQLKRALFGCEDIILHTADITRNRNGFEALKDPSFRNRFYEELNRRMARWEYQVIAVLIDKAKHLERYGSLALDPYDLSLEIVLERLVLEGRQQKEEVEIFAESRGRYLDERLRGTWENVRRKGTRFCSSKEVCKWVTDLQLRQKQENIAGLQVADLVATPIGRSYLNKKVGEDWRIVQDKFRRGSQGYAGYGLVVLPKD